MVGRCAEEPFVVGVTANDSVEHNHVGRSDPFGIHGDVVDAPLCSFVGSCFLKKLRSLVLVRSRELEVERAGSAQLQEFDMDIADSATDLEDGRLLDACLLEKADHPQGCLV